MYDDVPRFTARSTPFATKRGPGEGRKGVAATGAPRLILSGTPMALPNWKVPHVIETSGAVIVAEEMCGAPLF